jgi:hypothetical protein
MNGEYDRDGTEMILVVAVILLLGALVCCQKTPFECTLVQASEKPHNSVTLCKMKSSFIQKLLHFNPAHNETLFAYSISKVKPNS